jgi:hypothetical protein
MTSTSGSSGMVFYVHFLCLPKENEPKERAAVRSPLRC